MLNRHFETKHSPFSWLECFVILAKTKLDYSQSEAESKTEMSYTRLLFINMITDRYPSEIHFNDNR